MANQEQMQILIDSCQMRDGCKSWNLWRQQNPMTPIDLSNISFMEQNFAGANLSRADLCSSLLVHCNLNLVNLSYSQMDKASLANSSLREANLSRTVLTAATLTNVDLTGSILSGTNLEEADLRYSDLFQSKCMGTNFAKCDLGSCYLQMVIVHLCNLEGAILTGAFVFEIAGQIANAKNIKCSHLEYGMHAGDCVLNFSSLEEVAQLSLFLEQHSVKELFTKRMGREPDEIVKEIEETTTKTEAEEVSKAEAQENEATQEEDEIAELKTQEEDEIAELKTQEEDEIAELKTQEEDEIAELKTQEEDKIAELKTQEEDEIAELKTQEEPISEWGEGADDDIIPEFAYFPDDVEADEIPKPPPKPKPSEPEQKPQTNVKDKWELPEDFEEEEETMEENYLEHLLEEEETTNQKKETKDDFGFYDD